MWTRFNFFLAIELALCGFLGYLLFYQQGRDPRAAIVSIVLGLTTPLAWYVVGAQDRFLVNAYRNELEVWPESFQQD